MRFVSSRGLITHGSREPWQGRWARRARMASRGSLPCRSASPPIPRRQLPATGATRMRTIHLGLRVTDARRSIAFYTAVGYEVVGRVPDTPIGELTMLKLPADEFVTIELVHDRTDEERR